MEKKTARVHLKEYWDAHAERPTIQAMMLNDEAHNIDNQDRNDILSSLPDIAGADIVEIGAGIGRYTGGLLERSKSVHATDFIDTFVEENQRLHGHHDHATFEVADAAHLDRGRDSCDFVFTNWLLMYLTHNETVEFLLKCLDWLRPNGFIHIRESCSQPSTGSKRDNNPTYYRHVSQYMHLLDTIAVNDGARTYGFKVLWVKSVGAYIDEHANWRQAHMVVKKVELLKRQTVPVNHLSLILEETSVNLQKVCDSKWYGAKELLSKTRSPIQESIIPIICGSIKTGNFSQVLILNPDPVITAIDPHAVSKLASKCQVICMEFDACIYSCCLNVANECKNKSVRFGWSPSVDEVHINPVTDMLSDYVTGFGVLNKQSTAMQTIASIKECMLPGAVVNLFESFGQEYVPVLKRLLSENGFHQITITDISEKIQKSVKEILSSLQANQNLENMDQALVNHWTKYYQANKFGYYFVAAKNQ